MIDVAFKNIERNLQDLQGRMRFVEQAQKRLSLSEKPGAFTAGSVLFASTPGKIGQDNTKLFWDDTNNRLGIGTNTPGVTLDVTGQIRASSSIESTGSGVKSSGTSAGLTFVDRTGGENWQWYGTSDTAVLDNGTLNVIQVTSAGITRVLYSDSGTSNAADLLELRRRTTGTAAAGFESRLVFFLDTNGASDRTAATIQVVEVTATDASRKFRTIFNAADTANREYLRGEASGSAPMIGFLGASAITRPTVSGSRATDAWRTSLMTALVNLGLVTDSSTA